jgi:signal transduction histidine kinase
MIAARAGLADSAAGARPGAGMSVDAPGGNVTNDGAPIGAKRILGFVHLILLAIGFVALIGMAVASVTLTARNQEAFDLANTTQKLLSDTAAALQSLEDAETGQRGFLLTEREIYLEPYKAAVIRLPEQLSALTAETAGMPVADAVGDFAEKAKAKMDELAATIALYRNSGRAGAVAEVLTDRGRIYMEEARRDVDRIRGVEESQLTARLETARRLGGYLVAAQVGTVGLVLGIALLTGLGLSRNVGELRRAQAALAATNANLEDIVALRTRALSQANDEIQKFAYIVSHDLRSPLVNIMGFTTELESAARTVGRYVDRRRKAEDSDVPQDVIEAIGADVPEAFAFIKTSTAKMDRLIGAILKLSREGRRILTPEPLAMGPLLEGIRATLQHKVLEKNAEIVIDAVPDLVSDRLAVEQIFSNLLDNAVKYLAPGRPGMITVRGAAKMPLAVFQVQDNGRGIAPADRERVFELFRRSGEQNVPGEGIGLAYVRQLVYRLGGTIELDSEIGKGTIFTLSLPLVGAKSQRDLTA